MTRRIGEFRLNDFSGGLHTACAITELDQNESPDLSNIVISPGGSYIRSRNPNSTFNSSAMNGGTPVQGLSYLKLINGNEFLFSVCGDKAYKSDALDGVMDDVTGALSITSGKDNIWTLGTFNNIHIGFGGPASNPDTPIRYTGSGNAVTLSASAPAAYGFAQGNNRIFAFRTAASPSIVQWSVLGDGTDYSGTGSGSQTISTSDNDSVTAMAVLSNSVALVFKQNSVHKMLISQLVSSAFPVFPLFSNVGCAGKHACVVVGNLCYFMTPHGEMKVTDGDSVFDGETYSRLMNLDDLWSSGNTARYEFIQGKYVEGEDYRHIVWLMTSTSSGTTHDTALIWDLDNDCWLRNKTGYKMNVIAKTQSGVIYTGNYTGTIYRQDVTGSTADASESSANVDSYWSSGWGEYGSYDTFKTVSDAYLSFTTQSAGNIQFSYGYDFNNDAKTIVVDQRMGGDLIGTFIIGVSILGGQTDVVKLLRSLGSGRVFRYKIRNNDYKMKINSLTLNIAAGGLSRMNTGRS